MDRSHWQDRLRETLQIYIVAHLVMFIAIIALWGLSRVQWSYALVAIIITTISFLVSSFQTWRGQKRDALARTQCKEKAVEAAVNKIISQQPFTLAMVEESISNKEGYLRTQRKATLRKIIEESFQDV